MHLEYAQKQHTAPELNRMIGTTNLEDNLPANVVAQAKKWWVEANVRGSAEVGGWFENIGTLDRVTCSSENGELHSMVRRFQLTLTSLSCRGK